LHHCGYPTLVSAQLCALTCTYVNKNA
jgi:hypothetical protein